MPRSQNSRRNHTVNATSSSVGSSDQQDNPASRNRQGSNARWAQDHPGGTEPCYPTMSYIEEYGKDYQGDQQSFTSLLDPGASVVGHLPNRDLSTGDAYDSPGGLEAYCHIEGVGASDAATPPGNALANPDYGAESLVEGTHEVQTSLQVQPFNMGSPGFEYAGYSSLILGHHDPTGQGYLSRPSRSPYYYTQTEVPQAFMYQAPPPIVVTPPSQSSRSRAGLFPPPVPRPEYLTNDFSIIIKGGDRDYPLLACVKDEYENSYMHTGTAIRLGLKMYSLPDQRQRGVLTPLGTYETPKSFSKFTADIDALGVKGLDLNMLNLDWMDSNIAQVILGSKLFRKLGRQMGIGQDDNGTESAPGGHVPQGTSYDTSQTQQLLYDNSRPEGSFPGVQHYDGWFGPGGQSWSQVSVISSAQESPPFTVVQSISSTTSVNEESILAPDNG